MNINREALIKGINLSDKEYPTVVIKDREISRELKGFLGRRFSIEMIFGQILSQFGFNKDDLIVLKNIEYNRGMNAVKFEYSVNLVNDSENKIILDFNCFRQLIVSNRNVDVVCDCSVTSKNDIRVYLKKIEEKINSFKTYTHKYGYTYSEYSIKNGNDEISLTLRKDNDNDYKEYMLIENDLKIEEYFKNMDLNCDIDKIYKDISEYLGNIDNYKDVKLEINKIINNKSINTDLLVLENGICKEFMITRNGRCIYLNSNGELSYNFNGRFYTVSSLGKDDRNITYSVNADNDEILKYVIDTKGYVEDVVSDVEDTKKLVRSMFNRDRK